MPAERAYIENAAVALTRDMFRSNSEQALQAIIELMLTDHSTAEVVAWLRTWADYLTERS